MKKLTLAASGFVAALAFCAPAYASIVDLTSSVWLTPNTGTSQIIDGVTVTLTPTGGVLAADTIPGNPNPPCTGTIDLACNQDGVGITQTGAGDDEVGLNNGENLKITFSSAVTLKAIGFLDLFNESPAAEKASWKVNGGATNSVTGTATDTIGWYLVSSLTVLGVTTLDFFIDATSPGNSDFALAYIEFIKPNPSSDVPVPAALPLLASGLLGAGSWGWFRKKKNRGTA